MSHEEDRETFPSLKGGKAKFPEVGGDVYVPTLPALGDYVIGGRGKVVQIRASFEGNPDKVQPRPTKEAVKDARIVIEEYPTVEFRWGDIRDLQYELWGQYKAARAHPSSPEELAAIRESVIARFTADRQGDEKARVAEMRAPQRATTGEAPPAAAPLPAPVPPPTHVLKVQPRGSNAWTHVGLAWRRPDGGFNIRLNPCVTLSWKDEVRICLVEPQIAPR